MYNLQIERILEEIMKNDAKRVLLQFPDGLKPKSEEIVEKIEQSADVEVFIWFSSCYGGCDIPIGLERLNFDLLLQFGHNNFIKEEW